MSDNDGWNYEGLDPYCDHVWVDLTATTCQCENCDGFAYMG